MSASEMSDLLSVQLERVLEPLIDGPALAAVESGDRISGLEAAIGALELEQALVPEDAGGHGLGFSDLCQTFESLGYFAEPSNLGQQIVAQWLLAKSGLKSDHAAIPALGRLTLSADGALNGEVLVLWPVSGARLLVEATTADGGFSLCLLDGDELRTAQPAKTVARQPTQRMILQNAAPMQTVEMPAPYLLCAMAVLRSAYISGALARLLELCIEHANTRTQFGRPIGKFQAVQQMIAELAGNAAAASAATRLGMNGMDAESDPRLMAAVAKAQTSELVARSAAIGHQVHGAIGVTDEHILHYFTRRLWQWREEAGNEHYWSEMLGRTAIEGGTEMVWDVITKSG